jgi:hypothetical protein
MGGCFQLVSDVIMYSNHRISRVFESTVQTERLSYLGSKSRLISHAESVMSSVFPVDRHVHVCPYNLGS